MMSVTFPVRGVIWPGFNSADAALSVILAGSESSGGGGGGGVKSKIMCKIPQLEWAT